MLYHRQRQQKLKISKWITGVYANLTNISYCKLLQLIYLPVGQQFRLFEIQTARIQSYSHPVCCLLFPENSGTNTHKQKISKKIYYHLLYQTICTKIHIQMNYIFYQQVMKTFLYVLLIFIVFHILSTPVFVYLCLSIVHL